MSTEREKSEQRIQLNRQHQNEWNTSLALETQARSALDARHEQERCRVYEEEINFHQRATLVTRQLEEVKELRHQDRKTRLATLKRHAQEHTILNQQLG